MTNLDILKFSERDDGTYVRLPSKNLLEIEMQLCNFSIDFVRKILQHNSNGTTVELLEIKVTVDGSANIIRIEKNFFQKLVEEILQKLPQCCLMGDARTLAKPYLREFFALKYGNAKDTLPIEKFFLCHGWHVVDGVIKFYSNSDKNCTCAVSIPKIYAWEVLKIYQTGEKILKVADLQISLPFFLYLHAGYAAKLFDDAGLPVQFLFLLVGKTGSLKTTLCKTFAIPFNEEAILRIESTQRASELLREQGRDMIIVADDIFRQRKGVMQKFEAILRPFGDGLGRAKSYKNKIDKIEVRGGCSIVTAESPLGLQQSSALRTVTVQIERSQVNLQVLTEFQEENQLAKRENRPNSLQKYFAAWINFLEKNYKKLVEKIAEESLPHKVQERIEKFPLRYRRIFKIFLALSDLILTWGMAAGALEASNFEKIFQNWSKIILDLLEKNVADAIQREDWKKFLITLNDGIGTGEFEIATTKADFETSEGKFLSFKSVKNDEEIFILSPIAIWSAVTKKTKIFSENRTDIFKELCERDVAMGYETKNAEGKIRRRYLKKIKFKELSVEMLIIKKVAMESAVEKILNEN